MREQIALKDISHKIEELNKRAFSKNSDILFHSIKYSKDKIVIPFKNNEEMFYVVIRDYKDYDVDGLKNSQDDERSVPFDQFVFTNKNRKFILGTNSSDTFLLTIFLKDYLDIEIVKEIKESLWQILQC
jgi:hypothetical protein